MMKRPSFFPFVFNKKKDPLPKNFLPKIRTKVMPGPKSAKLTEQLKRFECPQITYVGGPFPVYLKRAFAGNIIDVEIREQAVAAHFQHVLYPEMLLGRIHCF